MADEYAKHADKLMASSDKDNLAARRHRLKAALAHKAANAAIEQASNARIRGASKQNESDIASLLTFYRDRTFTSTSKVPFVASASDDLTEVNILITYVVWHVMRGNTACVSHHRMQCYVCQ